MAHKISELPRPLKAGGRYCPSEEVGDSWFYAAWESLSKSVQCDSRARLHGRVICALTPDEGLQPHHPHPCTCWPATHLLFHIGCTHTTVYTIVLSVLKALLPSLLALAVYFTTLQKNFSYKNSSSNVPLLLYWSYKLWVCEVAQYRVITAQQLVSFTVSVSLLLTS